MFKVSVWLRGGGKIVEECNIDFECIEKIYDMARLDTYQNQNIYIHRSKDDKFPIMLRREEIAALQIDERFYEA